VGYKCPHDTASTTFCTHVDWKSLLKNSLEEDLPQRVNVRFKRDWFKMSQKFSSVVGLYSSLENHLKNFWHYRNTTKHFMPAVFFSWKKRVLIFGNIPPPPQGVPFFFIKNTLVTSFFLRGGVFVWFFRNKSTDDFMWHDFSNR